MIANYHTHTTRCQHAVGSDREYIESAIRSGIKVLGFSDHCPWVFKDGYFSHTRMLPGDVEEYFTSLTSLRDEYSRDITIYIGFESEYIPELMQAQDELLKGYPLDYMILGEHFTIPEPVGQYTGLPTDSDQMLVRYVDMVIEGMESGRYKYVAHPDLINYTGSSDFYDLHMTRLCKYFAEHDLPVEINMLGTLQNRNYPSSRFLRLAADSGCSAIIGMDAHTPAFLESREGEIMCRNKAKSHNLPLIELIPGLEPKN